MFNLKQLALTALRARFRSKRNMSYGDIARELREVIREMADQHPLLNAQTVEQLQYLMVDKMNHMVMDQQIEFGRIVGYGVENREIKMSIEITPVRTIERVIINLRVGP